MSELHVTNGDHAAADIRSRLGVAPQSVLAWRDVLHDGPVRAGLDAAQLRAERAGFLAALSHTDPAAVRVALERRDHALAQAVDLATRVTLWFEDDLYDQLQLIQILDRLHEHNGPIGLVELPRPNAGGVRIGLSERYGTARQLGDEQRERTLALGVQAWTALRAAHPLALHELVLRGTPSLPHLAPALGRLLEQLPATTDGLARTERQLLTALAAGHTRREGLFTAATGPDVPPFMGDVTLWWWLEGLTSGPDPLVAVSGEDHELTAAGQACLAGRADRVALTGGIDRWLGGTHLTGTEPAWRWDPVAAAPRPTT